MTLYEISEKYTPAEKKKQQQRIQHNTLTDTCTYTLKTKCNVIQNVLEREKKEEIHYNQMASTISKQKITLVFRLFTNILVLNFLKVEDQNAIRNCVITIHLHIHKFIWYRFARTNIAFSCFKFSMNFKIFFFSFSNDLLRCYYTN